MPYVSKVVGIIGLALLGATIVAGPSEAGPPKLNERKLCKEYRMLFDQLVRDMEETAQVKRAKRLRAQGYHHCRTGRRGYGQYLLQGAIKGLGTEPDPNTLITFGIERGRKALRRVYPELKGRVSERLVPTQ